MSRLVTMSRIGKLPITLPSGVTVTVDKGVATTVGPKGTLLTPLHNSVTLEVAEDKTLLVQSAQSNMQGLFRSLIANSVKGVSEGWTKSLELSGTGYRAATTGQELNLALGFSHPVVIKAPAGISFQVLENKITVLGADKGMVGEIAAKIRAKRPADPYKAKGLKYEGEVIQRKAGKAAKAGATK